MFRGRKRAARLVNHNGPLPPSFSFVLILEEFQFSASQLESILTGDYGGADFKGLVRAQIVQGRFFPSAENKRLRPNYRFLEKKNASKLPALPGQGRRISRSYYTRGVIL